MKKILFLIFFLFSIVYSNDLNTNQNTQKEKIQGNLSGTVAFLYNSYFGFKPDFGSHVYVIELQWLREIMNLSSNIHTFDFSFLNVGLTQDKFSVTPILEYQAKLEQLRILAKYGKAPRNYYYDNRAQLERLILAVKTLGDSDKTGKFYTTLVNNRGFYNLLLNEGQYLVIIESAHRNDGIYKSINFQTIGIKKDIMNSIVSVNFGA